jgi:hypothetical protein
MTWIDVEDYRFPGTWREGVVAEERAREYCRHLEAGKILYFKSPPFSLPQEDREFLLSQRQSSFKGHKNVSYRPSQDLLRGNDGTNPEDSERLRRVMASYSSEVIAFVKRFLSPYAQKAIIDFASYRPIQEQGRDLPLHKRNDLLHVDAFPSRPTHGGRILRVFTNINPTDSRVWETTDGFEALANHFAADAGLSRFANPSASREVLRTLAPVLKKVGIRGMDRSPYDQFMLRFHDYLKENQEYQKNWKKIRLEFPPGSTWLVYTDTVPHAVLSGKYAMEQTFIIPMAAMVAPEIAPLRVLEKLSGRTMARV